MKTIKNILLMTAVAGTLFLASCAKEPVTTTTPPTTTSTGVLKCNVNGTAWQSEAASKMYISKGDTTYGTVATLTNGELTILGTKIIGADTSKIYIKLVLTPNKTGTYAGTFNISAADNAAYSPKSDIITISTIAATYKSTYSVTLTKVDEVKKLVSGLFTITQLAPAGLGAPDYKITDGTFEDIKFY